jgi:hypothetical protein
MGLIVWQFTALFMALTAVNPQKPPVSMGSLVLHAAARDPDIGATLTASASHEDAGIRAIAARVVGASGENAAAGSLIAALSRETDALVAAEQVRALLLIATPEAEAAVDSHLERAKAPAIVVYSLRLARSQPLKLVAELPRLMDRIGPASAEAIVPAVVAAMYQHPSHRAVLLGAWLSVTPAHGWSAALRRLDNSLDSPTDSDVVLRALNSSDESIRTATLWMVLGWMAQGRAVSEPLLIAGLPRPDGVGWERIAREMISRGRGSQRLEDQSDALGPASTAWPSRIKTLASMPRLTREERSRLGRLVPARSPGPTIVPPASPRYSQLPRLRTVDPIWPGFIHSLLAASNCAVPRQRRHGLLQVTYGPDGRPETARRDRQGLSEGCSEALAAYLSVVVADEDVPLKAGDTQWLLFPVDRAFIDCSDRHLQDRTSVLDASDVPGGLTTTERPRPEMPRSAQSRGQAAVALDGIVSSAGCMASAAVVAGGPIDAELEALTSLLQWRFRPIRVGGNPAAARAQFELSFVVH